MSPSRRDVLVAAAGAGVAATAGCLDALPFLGGPPTYAKWLPSDDAEATVRPGVRYVEPGAYDDGSRPDELVGVPRDDPVRLPRQSAGVVVGDRENAPDRPSVELDVDVGDVGWQFGAPASSFRVVHGGGVASATRSALKSTDEFERGGSHRGFDVFEPDGKFAAPVAIGEGSVFVPPRTVQADPERYIDVRRGDGRLVAADDGFAAMVDRLGTAALVAPRPPHEPLTLSGDGASARALDGARGGGLRLSPGGDSVTVRYVILYESGTDPPTDAVRTYVTEQATSVRPASMHDSAEVSVSTTKRLAVVNATLPADDLRGAHLVFPV